MKRFRFELEGDAEFICIAHCLADACIIFECVYGSFDSIVLIWEK